MFASMLAMALALSLLTGAAGVPAAPPADPDIPAPGGTSDNSWNAPKTVESTEIVSAYIYTMNPGWSETLTARCYRFSVKTEDNVVTGTYVTDGGDLQTFTADRDFLTKLQQIVADGALVKYNGHARYTYGLPDDFGTTVRIEYASGEYIRFSDNQSPMMSAETLTSLAALFEGAVEK